MNTELTVSPNRPIYMQVREHIETQIRNKSVKSGELLPSPNSLAQKLSIDKGEVQRAYYELEHSGLILKTAGKDFLGKPKTTYSVK